MMLRADLNRLDRLYEEKRELRDRAWSEGNEFCRCSDPVPDRSYLRQKQDARCLKFIQPKKIRPGVERPSW